MIRELKHEGMTMLIATHEMSFARDVADQVCYLQDGRIVERGSPEQIFTAPSEPRPSASWHGCWTPIGSRLAARPRGAARGGGSPTSAVSPKSGKA